MDGVMEATTVMDTEWTMAWDTAAIGTGTIMVIMTGIIMDIIITAMTTTHSITVIVVRSGVPEV